MKTLFMWQGKDGKASMVQMDYFRINLLDATVYILIGADLEGDTDFRIVSPQKQKSSRVLGQLNDLEDATLKDEIIAWMNMSGWDNESCDNPAILEIVLEQKNYKATTKN